MQTRLRRRTIAGLQRRELARRKYRKELESRYQWGAAVQLALMRESPRRSRQRKLKLPSLQQRPSHQLRPQGEENCSTQKNTDFKRNRFNQSRSRTMLIFSRIRGIQF